VKLSPTMRHALTFAEQNGGRLIRHSGGYWSSREWVDPGLGNVPSFSTNTAHALVTRGVAEYTDWRENRNGRYAVELRIKERL
jgi:hypothetical protein